MEEVWDCMRYRKLLQAYKAKGEVNGYIFKNTNDVCQYLADKTHLASYHTFRSWVRKESNGPRKATRQLLEDRLGIKLTCMKEKDTLDNQEKVKMDNVHYDIYVATHVFEIRKAIKNYLRSDTLDTEEAFYNLVHELEIESFGVPDELYTPIKKFVDSKIDPIIFNSEGLFGSPGNLEKLFQYIFDIEKEFDQYMDSIKPLLISNGQ